MIDADFLLLFLLYPLLFLLPFRSPSKTMTMMRREGMKEIRQGDDREEVFLMTMMMMMKSKRREKKKTTT